MMAEKKYILDKMKALGFQMNKPFFWYLEFFTLDELKDFEKRFYKRLDRIA